MNTWILDTAIARLLSTHAAVLIQPPNSQTVGNSYLTRLWKGCPSTGMGGQVATLTDPDIMLRAAFACHIGQEPASGKPKWTRANRRQPPLISSMTVYPGGTPRQR